MLRVGGVLTAARAHRTAGSAHTPGKTHTHGNKCHFQTNDTKHPGDGNFLSPPLSPTHASNIRGEKNGFRDRRLKLVPLLSWETLWQPLLLAGPGSLSVKGSTFQGCHEALMHASAVPHTRKGERLILGPPHRANIPGARLGGTVRRE